MMMTETWRIAGLTQADRSPVERTTFLVGVLAIIRIALWPYKGGSTTVKTKMVTFEESSGLRLNGL